MKKGKLTASRIEMGDTIRDYYEIYECNIDGQIFYIEKKYKEVIISNSETITECPRNICNVYNHNDYLDTLESHLGFGDNATIEWIEPLTEVESDDEITIDIATVLEVETYLNI